jgi:2-polyprenyl-6-methoxyphenol hydroxylase-like FAD-dependent oxidoreductase
MQNTKILISGAGVAGPALACWLGRYGFQPTVVEVAPTLRKGGYAVDFRSDAHLFVLREMGILAELRARQTGGLPWHFVDDTGQRLAGLPPEAAGGEVEVSRDDLARVLFEHATDDTEYLFNDSICGLTETEEAVLVRFASGTERTFDLVIGADGLHSNVRELGFGPERDFLTHLGFYLARWQVRNEFGVGNEVVAYNEPGRMISVAGDRRDSTKADACGIFAAEAIAYDHRDTAAQKVIHADAYAGTGWRATILIDALGDTDELYFDSISRVDMTRWSNGRVALIGDAAHAATLGGMGVGAAVVDAYVLAGELAEAGGDHRIAFPRYEQLLRTFVSACQEGGQRTGETLAPASTAAIEERNRMFNEPVVMAAILAQGNEIAANIDLKSYTAYSAGPIGSAEIAGPVG